MQFSCKRNIKAISGDRKQNVCVFLTLWMSITNITGAPGSHTWLHKSDVSARPDVYNLPPLCRFVTSYLDHFHIRTVSMDVAIKNLVRHWGNVGKGMEEMKCQKFEIFLRIIEYEFAEKKSWDSNNEEGRNSAVDPLFWSQIRIAILFDNIARLINSRYSNEYAFAGG